MCCLLSLLLSLCVVINNCCVNATSMSTSKDYVNLKLNEARNSLRALIDARYNNNNNADDDIRLDTTEVVEGKLKNLWSRSSDDDGGKKSCQPRAVNLFDEMFMIDERGQVLPVTLNLDDANNNNHHHHTRERSHQLNLASPNQPIKFIKSYLWNGLSFLIVCQVSYCTHYQAADIATFNEDAAYDGNQHQQHIKYLGFIPIDACFFTHADKPYLIIAYNFDNNYLANEVAPLPTSKMYQWNGTQMAYVADISVVNPKSVITFKNDRQSSSSTLILFTIERNAIIADATTTTADRAYCVIYELTSDQTLIQRIGLNVNNAVMSIYPYYYADQQFFLSVNDDASAEILCWNGFAFEKLVDLPVDLPPLTDQMHLVQIGNNDVLLFIRDSNVLRVYKIENEKIRHLNDLALSNERRVVEITAWKYDNTTIMFLLVEMNLDGTFQTELWQLDLPVEKSDDQSYAEIRALLGELKDLLDTRATAINRYNSLSSNNSSDTFPLHLGDLIVNNGSISVVEYRKQNHATVASPLKTKEKLLQLRENVRIMKNNMSKNTANFFGNVRIDNGAHIDEFRIDNLETDYVNGEPADFANYLVSGSDQQFSKPLAVKHVSIDNLSISTLCGYGSDHWMRVNDSTMCSIGNLKNINSSSIVNDTIVIGSQLMTNEINTRYLNGIDLQDFLENLFVIGKEQVIKGDVRYEGIVQVMMLRSDKVNNVSSSDLISKPSNQSLQDVYIDSLRVEQIYVDRINGVPIDKAARMSCENVIKGKVTLTKFIITDELTVNENIAIPLTHSTQVYDQIHIDGNVFLKNLELEDHTTLKIDNMPLPVPSINSLVKSSWSKSSDQLIVTPITLQKGASVDQLDCLYLNGLGEHDFLYTDSTELSDLENVTFANFHFNNVIAESLQAPMSSFIEESNDHLMFQRPVRMSSLNVENIFTDKYNGIAIESIMQPNELLDFPDEFQFDTVRVHSDDVMMVDELRVNRRLNLKNVDAFRKALLIDQRKPAMTLNSLLSSENTLNLTSLYVRKLNGRDFEDALSAQQSVLLNWSYNNKSSSIVSVTIEAEVTIEGGIQTDRINNKTASDYMSEMRRGANNVDKSSLASDCLMEIKSLVNLTVVENLEVGQLNGQNVDDFFVASLSRGGVGDASSRNHRQTLNGQVAIIDAQINYLTADTINSVDLSKLIYVDQPNPVFHANLSFRNLYLSGDVRARTFNGQIASKNTIKKQLQRRVENLLVLGEVKWDVPSSNWRRSLAHLLDNAVTKHEDQRIHSTIRFEESVVIESMYLTRDNPVISRKIAEIIDDTVVDNIDLNNPIAIHAAKTFKRTLIVGDLQVDGNIDVESVNDLDIREISKQIFQKNNASEIVTADITFLDKVEITRLHSKSSVHGVDLQQLAVLGMKMPKKLHFHDLIVDGDVSTRKLDGIEFDDFIKRRVTIDEDSEIFVDVDFLNSVRVLNTSFVAAINGIRPENLIQSNADGMPIIVNGNKIFQSELNVEKNIETTLINDFQVDSIYQNAVGADANILGNLIFANGLDIYGNVTVSGEINGLKLQTSDEIKYLSNRLKQSISNKSTLLLNNFSIATKTLDTSVLYVEEEKNLNWRFSRIQSIKSSPVKDKTRLEIVTEETPELCGLQMSDCFCKKQYIVDFLPSGEYEIQERNVNNITNTFYPLEGIYGLKIISTSTSYSEHCSKLTDTREHSKIFWLKLHKNREIVRTTPAIQINGYISDAQTFQVDDQLYLMMAIFYNKETKSHATDSLLYQFDLKNGKTVLAQRIPTDGAKIVNVFQIPNVGMHVLIGCVKGIAESILLRFNPATRQIIRTFATGGSKYIASVITSEKNFVILNNPDVRALQIFNYDINSHNFVDYQNLLFESKVTSLGVFYSGDFGHSDAFVVTTTKDGWLYIYEYMFYGKFQLRMSYWADDIQVLTPFRHMNNNYLFAGFKFNSTVYKVIQQGYY